MKLKLISIFALILSLSALTMGGCELYEQDEYNELVQIESYMIAGRTLPVVRVTQTLPLDQEYTFQDAALNGAVVTVSLLNENGGIEEVFPYSMGADGGIYLPLNDIYTVESTRTYRINVSFVNRDEELTAETTVPDQIRVINEVRDEVIYQSEEQLEIMLAPTVSTGNQNVFLFDTIASDPSLENLTPFYLAAVEDGDADIEDFFSNSSGLINEGNFDVMPDGSISLNFPWIGAAFYGENVVVTNSVDRNLSELIRSQEVQLGGSTLSPGEIPNLRYNIDGGIGIFGSISSDSVVTNFLRP